jgi:hypothetical protein
VYLVPSPKSKMINVRLTPSVHDDFKIACDLRGVSMSSAMHQFVVRTIREEKEREPKAFRVQRALPVTEPINKVVAHISPGQQQKQAAEDPKEEVRKRFIQQQEIEELQRRLKPRKMGDRRIKGNVEPIPDEQVRFVPHLGELTDETSKAKQKPAKKKAGGR